MLKREMRGRRRMEMSRMSRNWKRETLGLTEKSNGDEDEGDWKGQKRIGLYVCVWKKIDREILL